MHGSSSCAKQIGERWAITALPSLGTVLCSGITLCCCKGTQVRVRCRYVAGKKTIYSKKNHWGGVNITIPPKGEGMRDKPSSHCTCVSVENRTEEKCVKRKESQRKLN